MTAVFKVFQKAGPCKGLALLFVGLLLISGAPQLVAQPPAATDSARTESALAAMSRALRERDYRGLFTYEFGGALQSLRITHRVVDGVEYEHLEYLNGPSLRVEQQGRRVGCLSEGDQLLRGMLPELQGGQRGLSQHYHLKWDQPARIAGRPADTLQVMPRDDYRYGYTFYLDRETSLPLATLTLGGNRKVLERLQFVELELEASDDWGSRVGEAETVRRSRPPVCDSDAEAPALGWNPGWLPSGFVAAGGHRRDQLGEVRQYTDGLAAFSVFLSPLSERVAAQGKAQRGATVAYMEQHIHNNTPYTVTVVGEIPARTAQRIANSLQWVDGP